MSDAEQREFDLDPRLLFRVRPREGDLLGIVGVRNNLLRDVLLGRIAEVVQQHRYVNTQYAQYGIWRIRLIDEIGAEFGVIGDQILVEKFDGGDDR